MPVLACLTSGLTASIALEETARLQLPAPFPSSQRPPAGPQRAGGAARQPKTVLVTAAAGGTGQFAVQLAKLAGCRVVATCGGDDKAALLRQLGVDRVINYRSEDVKGVLKAEYPGGIDVIYESVGGEMFDLCVDALADRGTLVVIGMMSAYSSGWQRSAHEGLAEKLLWKSASVAGFFLLKYAPLWGPHLTALCELVAQGRLRAAIDTQRFVGVESAAAAVDRLQSGASSGKVVLQVAPELPAAAVAGL
ncbi:hypothetical protein MNEG_14451 [Monoraphidium neglectum]|uniref:Enoyl reductase (ER) domain-containing protein n=1 Tax=Monoraphidium neglectum TaxID=145388 RepID=A0A0D2LV59_9CHLO|nr:hypothetical protein MNEG_14451 [Monoraphidium neglectum]KIY93511.1 hypothetical protein MNEG_14451 [Monoraphidium neglectum]|eukprot:XP_013892531.1 hypothetical protein MNEG_14451 [Monoraphidium neglectum]